MKTEISLDKISSRMEYVIDLLDVAAKQYPIKALAPELKSGITKVRAESTLRAELNQTEGYKLGMVTAIMIMAKTGNLEPLDAVEDVFNRVAFDLPVTNLSDPAPLMKLVSRLSKEFSETVAKVAWAMQDGEITRKEAWQCLKELDDLIKVSVEFKGFLLFLTGLKK